MEKTNAYRNSKKISIHLGDFAGKEMWNRLTAIGDLKMKPLYLTPFLM